MSSSTPINIGIRESGRINLQVEQLTYEWVIERFKNIVPENGSRIASPIFYTGKNEEERWKLFIDPQSDGSLAVVLLPLKSKRSEGMKIKADVTLSIPRIGIEETFVDQNTCHTFMLIKRRMLLESCDSDDAIRIICKLNIHRNTTGEKCTDQVADLQKGQLDQDFRLLYKETKLSDFSVIVGSQKFPVHKVVLAARSPVFSAMFENEGMQENVKNEVEIERMEPAVVEAMLEFFYTDEVTNLGELAYGLLEAADKYDIHRLRSMCEKMLCDSLSEENAVDVLLHADLHRSHKLKERVMEFMADHLEDVVKVKSYNEIEDPKLLKELVRSIAGRKGSKK